MGALVQVEVQPHSGPQVRSPSLKIQKVLQLSVCLYVAEVKPATAGGWGALLETVAAPDGAGRG